MSSCSLLYIFINFPFVVHVSLDSAEVTPTITSNITEEEKKPSPAHCSCIVWLFLSCHRYYELFSLQSDYYHQVIAFIQDLPMPCQLLNKTMLSKWVNGSNLWFPYTINFTRNAQIKNCPDDGILKYWRTIWMSCTSC